MKQKILDAIKDFVSICNTMFKLGAADFAKEYFPKLVENNWDDNQTDEHNFKEIFDLFELNKRLNEIQGNKNAAQTIEVFMDGWLNKIKV